MRTLALFLILSAAGWQTIDFNGLFSFRLPDGFAPRTSLGPDDLRAEYRKQKTILVVVWGQSESPAYDKRQQDWMHDYHETTTRLGGLRANIHTYSQQQNSKLVYRSEMNVANWH